MTLLILNESSKEFQLYIRNLYKQTDNQTNELKNNKNVIQTQTRHATNSNQNTIIFLNVFIGIARTHKSKTTYQN